eukprot:9607-Heterococcus_DN1.PRE.1
MASTEQAAALNTNHLWQQTQDNRAHRGCANVLGCALPSTTLLRTANISSVVASACQRALQLHLCNSLDSCATTSATWLVMTRHVLATSSAQYQVMLQRTCSEQHSLLRQITDCKHMADDRLLELLCTRLDALSQLVQPVRLAVRCQHQSMCACNASTVMFLRYTYTRAKPHVKHPRIGTTATSTTATSTTATSTTAIACTRVAAASCKVERCSADAQYISKTPPSTNTAILCEQPPTQCTCKAADSTPKSSSNHTRIPDFAVVTLIAVSAFALSALLISDHELWCVVRNTHAGYKLQYSTTILKLGLKL